MSMFFLHSSSKVVEEDEGNKAARVLEQLEKEMEEGEARKEVEEEEDEETRSLSRSSVAREEEDAAEDEGAELVELRRKEEIRLLYQQDTLLEQVCS